MPLRNQKVQPEINRKEDKECGRTEYHDSRSIGPVLECDRIEPDMVCRYLFSFA